MKGHHSTAQRIIKSVVNTPTNDERYREEQARWQDEPRIYVHSKITTRTYARVLRYMTDQRNEDLGRTVDLLLSVALDAHDQILAKEKATKERGKQNARSK
jgi:hypothetical protein